MRHTKLTPRLIAVGIFAAVAAIFTTTLGTAAATASGHSGANCTINRPCIHGAGAGDVDRGTTDGWLHGNTVDFLYTKNFYCAAPPSSGAPGYCEAGANANFAPVAGQIDPLYVITPLGFTPPAGTLHCPTAGLCVDHPNNIDLSRIFGSTASDLALPPHSHVVTTNNKGAAEWWRIFVVGVKTQTAWNSIVDAKSIDAVQSCQASTNCTADIASNLFLFFAVKPQDAGADTPNR